MDVFKIINIEVKKISDSILLDCPSSSYEQQNSAIDLKILNF